ncbi:hypothetical protein ACFL6S_26440 [Candidatus Poribacteria bacterium]
MFRLLSAFLIIFISLISAMGATATEYAFLVEGDWPAWSPDDTRIAYSSGGNIRIINAKGGEDPVDLVLGGGCRAPIWSPDGSKIAFTSNTSGSDEIWIVKVDGNEDPVRLTDCATRNWLGGDAMQGDFPTWSPDGSLIIFHSGWGLGAPGFKTIPSDDDKPDGQKDMKILIDTLSDGRLSYSPDGTMIIYDADVNGIRDIWMANADGKKRHRVTDDQSTDLHPHWSPKRAFDVQIAFVSDRVTGEKNLWVMNADGGEPLMLTEERKSGDYRHPRWSNDGTKIAFAYNSEIWIASQLSEDIVGRAVNSGGKLTTTWGQIKGKVWELTMVD